MQSGYFRYEQYELKSIKFYVRTDKEEHSPGNPVALYLKAVDENDLPVADGRAEITLLTRNVDTYHNNSVFVPDTLWRHKLQLDAIGETKLIIPDSIFPKATFRYGVEAIFLNSNNERQLQSKQLTFTDEAEHIDVKLDQDTLKINYKVNGQEVAKKATITSFNLNDDSVAVSTVNLPAKYVINPNIKKYDIETDKDVAFAELRDYTPNITTSAYRTNDSLFIRVDNPRHIPFWYTVFSGNKIIDGGKATNLDYQKQYSHRGNVFMLINYVWGGESKSDEVTIVYRDQLLAINLSGPLAVNPGQKVPFEVTVKDALGKPVADADLTAMAVTTKFKNFRLPAIPYFGRLYSARKLKTTLEVDDNAESGAFELNWKRWGRSMGLDSIVYYQFTHPADIFRMEEPAPDTLAQIAPFVVKNGDILPVHLLYIDRRPVYFSQAGQLQRYSFIVSPGKHSLQFRTLNQTVTLDNVSVNKGKKLILSINADTGLNRLARFKSMPDTLTTYEARLIDNYMIKVVDNFGNKMATLNQGNDVILLNPYPQTNNYRFNYGYTKNEILAGPLASNSTGLEVRGEPSRYFMTEPGYSFEFQPGLIKQKSITGRYPFDTRLYFNNKSFPDYRQYALTLKEVDTLWQQYLDERAHNTASFKISYLPARNNGKLMINVEGYGIGNQAYGHQPLIKNIIVYRYDNPDYIRVYPGSTTDMGYLQPGNYRLFFLLKNDVYYIQNNVGIKGNGINYKKIIFGKINPRDSVSIKIAATATVLPGEDGVRNDEDADKLKLKEAFNEQYLDNSTFNNEMRGRVVDKQQQGLPGVSITVKGTKYGTVTDGNGNFKIKVPQAGTLMASFIGYQRQEVAISPGAAEVKIIMTESVNQLSEVVVTGYGTQRRADLTGAVSITSALQGKIASVMVRGVNSISAGNSPLYVVDGVVVENISSLDPASIADMSVLKGDAAAAIYGSRGANGVVMITTKKKGSITATGTPGQQQTLRTNFSDYAYWQPKLKTDAQGKVSFNVVFPDDITSWNTLVIGVAGKQSGYVEGKIKSFKSLSANMVSPQFAVKGDEMNVIGKIMNYTTGAVAVNRSFKYNGQDFKQSLLNVKNAWIDTFKVVAADRDSLKFEYTLKKDNGYFDGERRAIPVFEQGVLETKGTFADLEKDTTLTLKFNPALGKVTFRAEASVLPVLIDEVNRLRHYEYLCNEQLASKLKALLVEKRIRKYLGEPFKWNKDILELIKKLQDNRRSEGTWGWWKDTEEELWISLHAAEALIDAGKEGYLVKLDKQKLTDYLVYQIASYRGINKLDALDLLMKLGSAANYTDLIAAYESTLKPKEERSAYEKMRLMLIKQRAGIKLNLDSLMKHERHTMFGNSYWGENNYRFFDNSTQLSIIAYQLFKNESKHPELLSKIRNYFLEQRKDGYWRNTYESSLILETILPDLLTGGHLPQPPSITLSGGKNETVSQFPYTAILTANSTLSISKSGQFPVYITGYQQFWNKQPVKVSKDFTVNTWFEKGEERAVKLKGGEAVNLVAEVTARADADFVMVEIPIPAGCSYDSKEQNYWGNEIHREYFKNKVSIFCRKLKQGKYRFTVKLMPRYGGIYTLNPAKAEMMYFPVFYGREELRKVSID